MDFSDLFNEDLFVFDEKIQSKKELFEVLSNRLEEKGRATKSSKVVKDLYKREKQTSTGIEDGFGIPHTQSKYVTRPTICFAHTGEIEDYIGLDGINIEFVFAIFVPKKASNMHLEILSGLSRKLMNKDLRDKLKIATSFEEILNLIQ